MPGYDTRFNAHLHAGEVETVRTIESRIELDSRGDWYGENEHSRSVERRAEKIAEAIADGFTLATSFSYPDGSESIMVVDTFIRA